MSLIDKLKDYLKEGADVEAVSKILETSTAITPDAVKEFVAKEENKPLYDSLVSKAVNSHIEKEKAARSEWEKKRSDELLQEAMGKIEKENQKTPEMLKIEELSRRLEEKEAAELLAKRKESLMGIASSEKLPIPSVDLFASLGDDAETRMRDEATKINTMIDEIVQKRIAEKFGKGGMPDKGDNPPPTETKRPIFGSGGTTQAALESLNKATQAALE